MMTAVVGLSADELASLRDSPSWQALVATAHTLPREVRTVERYEFVPARFGTLHVPTALLEGDASPDELRVGVAVLADVLPRAVLRTMPGVGHEAVETGPDVFVEALLGVLDEVAPAASLPR
jgi:pimeloyl-ACP methyl ester carboxylesterase